MRKILPVISLLALVASACGGTSSRASAAGTSGSPGGGSPSGTHTLVGTFKVAAGACTSTTAQPSGSYMQMLGQGGAVVSNSFGGCSNPDYTPLRPGSKGLVTGSYQPNPSPAFKGQNAVAAEISQPTNFFGSDFAVATQSTDPQTGKAVPAPSITSTGGRLSGNLSAVDVAYNGSYFNQGSPKPGGSYPGSTKPVSGSISCDGTFTVEWQSLIVGGSFNNFTGVWHLTGQFVPASGTLASALGC